MKKLLAKIRKILHDRRTRRFLTRFVSGVAALIVFVTTYALVLPAITMEKEANCGIEAHQHDDFCYTEELICDIPESDGHHHDESCYSTTSALVCETEEHEHSAENGCYDDEGNLICEVMEHRHNEECYEEVRELTCQIPESEGHHHTEDCYEKVLTCGKEVHVHSTACYENDPVSESAIAASTSSAAASTTSVGSVSSAGMTLNFEGDIEKIIDADEPVDGDPVDNLGSDKTNGSSETNDTSEIASSSETNTEAASDTEVTYGRENAGTGRTETSNTALTNADNNATALTSSADTDQYIPQLDAVDFNTVLNNHTGIYYYRAADEDIVEDSSAIPAEDWNRIPNNIDRINDDMDDVELGNKDLLRVYLSYTIPAGSLNATNPVARYRLPSNLHLTDPQVKAINENVNGLAGQYVDMSTLEITDPDKYNAYLGVEAVEGTRRPDEAVEDYLAEQAWKAGKDAENATEYISAVVRVENVYDADGLYGEKDAYLGQDLIFTFAPYSIEKNQHEYDSTGKPTKAGEEIKGWFTFDLNMGQVDFEEPEITTSTVKESDTENAKGDNKDNQIGKDDPEDIKPDAGFGEDDNHQNEHSEDSHSVDNSAADHESVMDAESGKEAENASKSLVTIKRSERSAEIVFIEDDWYEKGNKINQISTTLTAVEKIMVEAQDDDTEENNTETAREDESTAITDNTTEKINNDETEKTASDDKEDTVDVSSGKKTLVDSEESDQIIMPAMSFTDSIKVSTGKPSGIDENAGGILADAAESLPEKAKVLVRVEADEGTFPAGTKMVLKAVTKEDMEALAETVANTVEKDSSDSVENSVPNTNTGDNKKNNVNRQNNNSNSSSNIKAFGFQAVDITFFDKDGNEIEPAKPVRVALTSKTVEQFRKEAENSPIADPVVVHVDNDGNAEQMELVVPEDVEPAKGKTEEELNETIAAEETSTAGDDADTADDSDVDTVKQSEKNENKEPQESSEDSSTETSVGDNISSAEDEMGAVEKGTDTEEQLNPDNDETESKGVTAGTGSTVEFEAESFSVYAIVYTVDFHWEVDGKLYQFSIAGGSMVSFRELVEKLHLLSESTGEDDTVEEFLADIKTIQFSDESLVQVAQITEDTTAGTLREELGVESEYSAELSDDQLEKQNEKEFVAPDWALISRKAFTTEEYLTVCMKNGESFQIRVTDGQIRKTVITASGRNYVVTVSYGDDAQIPDGAELRVLEITEEEEAYADVRREIKEGLEEGTEAIPSHPVLFDISIWYDDQEIEPAEGSEVLVEVKFVGNSIKGMYTDEDSPLLINDMPVRDDQAEMDKQFQVLHLKEEDTVDVMNTEDAISKREIATGFTTDSFSNWLLYLDEDLTSIDVTTGDSLTLRPYTEWVWKQSDEPAQYAGGQWTFSTSDWNVTTRNEGGVNYTIYTHKTNGSSFRSFSKTDSQLNETYTVITSVSLAAGTFDLKTNKGKTIHVNVTQGAASGKPDTVQGISGLTVNLFDYDVPYANGRYDFTKSGNLDAQSNVASNPNNNNNINTNHDLKFLGYGGSNVGNTDNWFWINNYTNANPQQGIVKDTLGDGGYPQLGPGKNGVERGNPSLKYLFDTSSRNSNVYAFPNADGLFQRDNQGYYYYNSNVNYAEYNQAANRFILYEHTYSQNTGGSNGANAKPIGFFPFHEYDTGNTQPEMNFNKNLNHHFGMSMEVEFEIPKDRRAAGDDGYKHDIIYEFSGDDDLWVFVDDELVLDIGGIHQPVTGSINFTTGVITVHGVNDKTMTFPVGAHTMKMFYMERGGCDSNLSVRFNLPLIIGRGNIRIAKKSMTTDNANEDSYLPGAVFGIWDTPNCEGDPYTVATSDRNGIIFKNLLIRAEGQKYYLKEISPPEGYLLDDTIYTLTAAGKDSNGDYTFTVSKNGSQIEDTDRLGYPIIRNRLHQPIKVEVHKVWQSADGETIDPEDLPADLTAKFVVKRQRIYTTDPFLTINLKSDASNAVPFATISAYARDVLTINYEHAPNNNGLTDYGTAKGQQVLTLTTNAAGSESSVTYTVDAQHAVDGVIDIIIPQSFLDYCDGVNYQGKNPEFNYLQSAERIFQREEDTVFNAAESEHEIVLTAAGKWTGSLNDLTVQEKINGVVYHYEYYVVEKEIPEGFEAIFLDSDGKPLAGSTSPTTTENNTQEVINRELMDVPLEKKWADFSGTAYSWTATFQLDQKEVKVDINALDASDALTTDFVPVPGKVMTIEKGQTPIPKFEDLPMYRVHDNGTVYRILYSVVEIGYTVERNGTIVAQWGKDENGETLQVIGDQHYVPQFDQDAGEHGATIDDYVIKIVNMLENRKLREEIDITIQKEWPEGSSYAASDDAYASFVLKRYRHREFRDYSRVSLDAEWVDITLETWGPGHEAEPQTVHVPKDTTVYIVGNIKPQTNANSIRFTQSSGQDDLIFVQNNPETDTMPFSITVTADQTKTISLAQGDNYVVGGRDGFRLSDTYGSKESDVLDTHFQEDFTLNKANDWTTLFDYLPLIEEQDINPLTGAQTIYVYSYYLEETDCNPKDFYPVFRDSSGAMVGDANSPIEYTTQLTAENVRKTIDVTLKKVSTDHLDDATEPPTLTGASFQLEKYTAKTFRAKDTTWGNNGVMFLSDDDEDGIFTFEGLSTGYYKVVEVSVPAGYVKLSEDPTFEVRLNADELEVILLNSDGTDADNNQTDMLRVNELIIRYGNTPGAALPNTGGPGTLLYTILGSILILGAGVLLWRRRRLI